MTQYYNAAVDLIQRNLEAGRADKVAFIDDEGSYTYGDIDRLSSAFANVLAGQGVEMEQRILLCLHDSVAFPVAFLGAIKAGVVPVPVNTLLTAADYGYMLADSRARLAVVSAPLLPVMQEAAAQAPALRSMLVAGGGGPEQNLQTLLAAADTSFQSAATRPDDMCFWLYSSGSTGAPKGTVHRHASLLQTAECYAIPTLGMSEEDTVFSAAKLFFAYGLGNALTFPMAVGATSVLMAERPTPESVTARLKTHEPTLFFGVPTLYAALLASPELPASAPLYKLRCCISAGEALPEEIGRRWAGRFGIDLLDGIGSTEMLHIFLSNRPDALRYGTSGLPVPGYRLRIVDEEGAPVPAGEIGELQISGPSSAMFYWNNREKTLNTFQGPWLRSGDKYSQDPDGYYVYAGRSDDMLKVGGIYVSPIEIEGVLVEHPAVLEVAVVGREDNDKLVKPSAFVVLQQGQDPSEGLVEELKAHVKSRLAPFKYPRWVEFLPELPKTATGKIQRYKLRAG